MKFAGETTLRFLLRCDNTEQELILCFLRTLSPGDVLNSPFVMKRHTVFIVYDSHIFRGPDFAAILAINLQLESLDHSTLFDQALKLRASLWLDVVLPLDVYTMVD